MFHMKQFLSTLFVTHNSFRVEILYVIYDGDGNIVVFGEIGELITLDAFLLFTFLQTQQR